MAGSAQFFVRLTLQGTGHSDSVEAEGKVLVRRFKKEIQEGDSRRRFKKEIQKGDSRKRFKKEIQEGDLRRRFKIRK